MTDDLLGRLAFGRQDRLLHVHQIAAREATLDRWPPWVDEETRAAHATAGVRSPWRHQVEAAELARAGRHVALATGTASGKSLAFGMVAQSWIREGTAAPDGRGATALYIAPTKALANDQLRSIDALGLRWLRAATYDGDTPKEERQWVRQHANYVLTNPDLLHYSMLPGHPAWSGFLRRLRLIVVDEAHVYRGVFGAHMSAVLRRARRLCAHYGSDPTVFVASATLANAAEAASRLVGAPVVAVTDDTSPRPGTTIAFWRPPVVRPDADDPESARRSALAEAADLLADCVVEGRQAVAFIRSRQGAEAVALMARDALAEVDPQLAEGVSAYRGGYLPEERRDLERRLRDGGIRALATTSALEMGIDVSGLDVVITAGWPGTRASLWQQFGRAGRASTPGLGIFVARDDPLDTYVVQNPGVVLELDVEASVFDPANRYVLAPHLCAAAAELPLTADLLDAEFGASARAIVDELAADGLLRARRSGWFWTHPERASDLTDLRGSGIGPIRIVEESTGRVLGTVDRASALSTVHAGAVYVHLGTTHVVTALDLDESVATVVEREVDYYTVARVVSDLRIVRPERMHAWGDLEVSLGEVDVTAQVVGFERRRVTGESLGQDVLDLPAQELRTRAVWWSLPQAALGAIPAPDLPGALHAAEHASIGLLPLFATCDRWDLGGLSTDCHRDTGMPTVFVYDGYPGGAGFAERGFEVVHDWLSATRALIAQCTCASGCPACIQSPKCGNNNDPLDKERAVQLLDRVLNSTAGDPAHGGPARADARRSAATMPR